MKQKLALLLFTSLFSTAICVGRQPAPVGGIIKAGNFGVYYETAGKGEPLLLIHAGLQDHNMWSEQVKVLSMKYEVITPDLPFHGKTTGRDTTLLAQDVIKILMDSLRLKKVSIAGVSLGASVVQDFIIAYPQRVNKAFLISPGINGYDKIYPVDSISKDWYFKFSGALQKKDTASAAMEFARAWAQGIYRSHDSLKSPASQYVYKTTLTNLQLHKMEGWPGLKNNPPAMESLATVHVPVLIIDGDKDLPYITAASAYLEKNIAGARRVVMKGVAHMLNIENPRELNKLMLEFLQSR